MTSFNVANFTREHAQNQPDVAALRFPSKGYTDAHPAWDSLTFAEFERLSDDYARGFAQHGVRRGDRALMLMKPQLHLWPLLFGLFKVGAAPVIVDPGMGFAALKQCIAEAACRVVIAETAVHIARTTLLRAPFKATEVAITVGPKLWWGGPTLAQCRVSGDSPFPIEPMASDDVAAIPFTSGSTGVPKGVVYHHGMWDAEVRSIREMMGMKPGDVSVQCFAAFAILDLCWGQTAVLPKMNLAKPATCDPAAIVAAIQKNKANTAFASPIVWQRTGAWCEEHGVTLHSLDKATTTGAPTPIWMLEQYRGLLREGVPFYTPYGATEAIPVSVIDSNELLDVCAPLAKAGAGTCVGRAAPGAEVRLIRITDEPIASWSDDLVIPDGEFGEIVARGEQISQRYYERDAATAEAKIPADEGFFHRMGDMGYIDSDGRIWFCGRKSHRLETAAGMVPPVPVEGVFNQHPAVFRTALVGVGPRGREVPVLCVELRKGQALNPVDAALPPLAAGTRWEGLVQRFLVHPGFPTDARHNSKIRRDALKAWATTQCADLAAGAGQETT